MIWGLHYRRVFPLYSVRSITANNRLGINKWKILSCIKQCVTQFSIICFVFSSRRFTRLCERYCHCWKSAFIQCCLSCHATQFHTPLWKEIVPNLVSASAFQGIVKIIFSLGASFRLFLYFAVLLVATIIQLWRSSCDKTVSSQTNNGCTCNNNSLTNVHTMRENKINPVFIHWKWHIKLLLSHYKICENVTGTHFIINVFVKCSYCRNYLSANVANEHT